MHGKVKGLREKIKTRYLKMFVSEGINGVLTMLTKRILGQYKI